MLTTTQTLAATADLLTAIQLGQLDRLAHLTSRADHLARAGRMAELDARAMARAWAVLESGDSMALTVARAGARERRGLAERERRTLAAWADSADALREVL